MSETSANAELSGPKKQKSPYFRDSLHTVDESGKRKWIYPKRPRGKYYTFRWTVAALLLAFFVAAPFIKHNGQPFMLLNFLERKFILFGQVFFPHDFHLLVLLIIALIVFIILFTVTYGRVFCGWACPQTIFMEFVFRQVEYLIEGDAPSQKRMDEQPFGWEKFWKKGLKNVVFILISLSVIHLFTAYLIGADTLQRYMHEGFAAHSSTFAAIYLLSGVFYFIYARFREQVCIILCPYGRLQGVLLDEKSIVVAYDYKRGEPRGSYRQGEDRKLSGKGDCVDCHQCVVVCPTGIDIRNGTQLECINCTACIDACNQAMKRADLPPGLIRFDSEKSISQGIRNVFGARAIAYTILLVILVFAIGTLFALRTDVEATVLRLPGSLYQEYGPDKYSNIYKIQIVNKTHHEMELEITAEPSEAEVIMIGNPAIAKDGKVTESTFMVVLPKSMITSDNIPIIISVGGSGKTITRVKTNFIGPGTR